MAEVKIDGDRLTELIRGKYGTAAAFAAAAGVSRQYVSQVVNNQVAVPPIDRLIQFAQLLGVDHTEFLIIPKALAQTSGIEVENN